MPEPTIPDGLLRYLEIRDQQRADAVAKTLAAMTEVERRIFREAAVMGYVLGVRSTPDGHHAEIPKDQAILEHVVSHIISSGVEYLYPITNHLTRRCETCGGRALDCGHPWPSDDEDEDSE